MSQLTEIALGLEKSWRHSNKDAHIIPWHICTVALAGGIVIGTLTQSNAPSSVILLILSTSLSFLTCFLHQFIQSSTKNIITWILSWCLLWIAFGCLLVTPLHHFSMPQLETCTITARIEAMPPSISQVTVRVAHYHCPSSSSDTNLTLRLALSPLESSPSFPLSRGVWIKASGQFEPFQAPDAPGMFDARTWARAESLDGRFVRTSLPDNPRTFSPLTLLTPPSHDFFSHLERSRRTAFDKLSSHSPFGIMPALVLGSGRAISPETRTTFGYLGIAHILAVSGLHFGIIALMVAFLFNKLISLSPWIMRRIGRKRASTLAALPALALYLIFVGAPLSARRALLMTSICGLGMALARKPNRIRALSIAALTILAIDPHALFAISFQLSFAAVLGIICTMDIYDRHLKPHLSLLPPAIRTITAATTSSLAITLGTSITTAPFVIAHFGQLPIVGILANLLVIPYVSFILMPLSIAALVGLQWSLPLAGAIAQLGATAEKILVAFAQWCADTLPAAWISVPATPTLILIVAALAALIFLPIPKPKLHLLTTAAGAALLVSVITITAISPRFWTATHDLRISFVSMGQADATLIEFPNGHTMLIDAGSPLGRDDNATASHLIPYLRTLGIQRIDTLVVTHADYDHTAGIPALLQSVAIGDVWVNGLPHPHPLPWERALTRQKIPIHRPNPRALDDPRHDLSIRLLSPRFPAATATPSPPNENESSIVLQITYKNFSLIAMGDAGTTAESQILAKISDSGTSLHPVTVLKVGHHGSKTASSDAWIDAIRPQFAIFSLGAHNRYHFPHPTVERRLTRAHARILRTDTHGTIRLTTDGSHILVQTMR